MTERDRASAATIRARIERGLDDPPGFRAALLAVAPDARDAWLDLVLGLHEIPDDGPDLPRGGVPYLPCSVDALLRTIAQAGVRASDVFVDIGSGLGRAAAFVRLFTGAAAIGIEVQSGLALAARDLATRLPLSRISSVEGDAAHIAGSLAVGTVFFLYCPFGGERLATVLDDLESVARARTIRVCCVDLPLPHRPWLALAAQSGGDLAIYRSTMSGGD